MYKYSQKSSKEINPNTHQSSRFRQNCQGCVKYEQDILILQQKLMDTHNKLIQQLDICREQQLTILKLNQNMTNENEQNYSNMEKYSKNEDLQSMLLNKNQLLRNDLQTMRNKVLSEILKSNKFKQEKKQLVNKHEEELIEFKQRIYEIQQINRNLTNQNQNLIQECQRLQKEFKNKNIPKAKSLDYEQKYIELDKAFMNQRSLTNQLIEENNALQNQLHEEKIKFKLQSQSMEKISERKKRKTPKKGHFQETKNLIKELEKAQKQIRHKY